LVYLYRYTEEQDAAAAARVVLGEVPDWPVALHAETLEWGDDMVFTAPPPWDREEPRREEESESD
jgi:hypothetical protein